MVPLVVRERHGMNQEMEQSHRGNVRCRVHLRLSGGLPNRRGPANGESSTGKQFAVQRSDCRFSLAIVFEFDETESTRFARGAVLNDFDSSGLEALGSEPIRQGVFCFREWDVANKQSVHSDLQAFNLNMPKAGRLVSCNVRQIVGLEKLTEF
jgi:hypothetical protein